MGVDIFGPGIYVPDTVITNADLENLVETSDEWIVRMTGMRERRISLDKGVREMGTLAAQKLIDVLAFNPEKIDEIILATNMHDGGRTFPAHAALIAADIGARTGIPAHDKLIACTGLIGAIREAYSYIVSDLADNVFVIGAERISQFTDYSDRNTCVLFGDGAGAYLLQRSEEEGIIKNFLGGEPDIGDSNWPNGYLTLEYKKGLQLVSKENGGFQTRYEEKDYLIMDGRKVFRFAKRVMREAVCEVVKDTGYSLKDVDVILPHGANIRIIEATAEGIEEAGFRGEIFTNLERYGNTSTASVPIAAAEAIEKGIIRDGSLVINVAFGAGFSAGANLYRARVLR